MAFTSSPSLLFLSDVTAGRAELAKCLMRILSVVLQQLVSAGKPSFAAILATNPPTSHPSLLPYFRSGFQDSSFEALSNWLGHFARCFPQPCFHFKEVLCYTSPTTFLNEPVIGTPTNACVLYDARVWSTTLVWSTHVPRLNVHLYVATVTVTLFACISIHLRRLAFTSSPSLLFLSDVTAGRAELAKCTGTGPGTRTGGRSTGCVCHK
jgi:hypothetical protein